MSGVGRIDIDGQPYNISLEPGSYKVVEVPSHGDVDPKMERRVIWRNFSLGIMRKREDPSMDATTQKSTTFTYMRQTRNPEGFYWVAGCDTTRQDRVFAQRATTASNMNVAGERFTHFVDGSLASLTFSLNKVYTLAPPGTWTLSATLSSANEVSDGIQYGGQIYMALGPTNGVSTAVGATTLTDSAAVWLTNQFTGAVLTSGTSTATVTSNTSTVLTFASWTGGTPATPLSYQLLKGFYTWSQLPAASWVQRSPSATHFTVIREQLWRSVNANIYDTVNTDPANQIWSGATVIGDPNTPITALDVFQDFLMIFKQDGVYSADKSGNVYPIFPGFKTLGTNPRPLGQWQDSYYFATDIGLIWTYSPQGGVRRIGFDFAEPYPMNPADPTNKYGIPNVAVTQGIALANYFIVGFNQYNANSTSSAFFLAWDGTGWHPLKYFANASVVSCGLTGGNLAIPNPILHFCIIPNGANTQIQYMTNPLIDPFIAANFDTITQTMYFPADSGALEDEYKVLERVNVFVDSPGAGNVKMFYSLDDEIAALIFHDMGDPQFQGVQGNQVFFPPQPLPSYVKIMLKMTITPTASTASPAVRNVVLHYHQRFPQRREWDISIIADQGLVGPNGRIDSRNAKKIIADLNTARVNHKQVVLQDALLEKANVYVNSVEQEIKILKGNRNPSFIVPVKLIEAIENK
jgi:hypothetical protein